MKISVKRRQLFLGSLLLAVSGCVNVTPSDQINGLATNLGQQLSAKAGPDAQHLRVGIVPFTDKSHQATAISSTLQSRLYTELVRSGRFEMIDKDHMDQIVAELNWQQGPMSDAIDPNTLAKLHSEKGVDASTKSTTICPNRRCM